MADTHLVVLGSRGSIPVSGPDFDRYGGNTSCFAIVEDRKAIAFIDAGTGLAAYRSYGVKLSSSVGVFLTHYHWDHIQGLSMLDELWKGACAVSVWGPDDPHAALTSSIRPPFFPVAIADVMSVRFEPMADPIELGGLTISAFPVHHPQGGIGYRIEGPERTVSIVTDHESGSDIDATIADHIAGSDVLIHDAQYLPDEAEAHRGWGHSTYLDAIASAEKAGASELILTSHDPSRTDAAINVMMADVRRLFPSAIASSQGLEVSI